MRNIVAAACILLVVSVAGISQQNRPRRPNGARPAIQDMVEGFYISQFPRQVDMGDEQFAKVLPILRQYLQERRDISTRRTRALAQLRMMIQRGNGSDQDIRKLIADIDRSDSQLQAGHEKFLAAIDPLLSIQQQAKVRMFDVAIDQRIRQMLDRLQNAARNPRPAPQP